MFKVFVMLFLVVQTFVQSKPAEEGKVDVSVIGLLRLIEPIVANVGKVIEFLSIFRYIYLLIFFI